MSQWKIFSFILGKNSNANASLCIIVLCVYSGYFHSCHLTRFCQGGRWRLLSLFTPGHGCASTFLMIRMMWASLVVQWLRLCTPNARDLSPVQGTRSRNYQFTCHDEIPCIPERRLKMLRTAVKTQHSRRNKWIFKKVRTVWLVVSRVFSFGDKEAQSQMCSSDFIDWVFSWFWFLFMFLFSLGQVFILMLFCHLFFFEFWLEAHCIYVC